MSDPIHNGGATRLFAPLVYPVVAVAQFLVFLMKGIARQFTIAFISGGSASTRLLVAALRQFVPAS